MMEENISFVFLLHFRASLPSSAPFPAPASELLSPEHPLAPQLPWGLPALEPGWHFATQGRMGCPPRRRGPCSWLHNSTCVPRDWLS